MAPQSLFEHKGTLMGIFFILMYFMWMDVALYYHIQAREPTKPLEDSSTRAFPGHRQQRLFSPFTGLTIKMMMIDPANHYIHTPAATIFNQVTHMSSVLTFVSPNVISVAHFFVAIVAAKLVASESLLSRQVGVVVFEFRSFLDCLDGVVARARAHQEANISDFGSIGYLVDGATDTLGSGMLILGCFIFLKRSLPRRSGWIKMSPVSLSEKGYDGSQTPYGMPDSLANSSSATAITLRRMCFVIACFGVQMMVSAWFWDHYVQGYHSLLENPHASEQQMILQNEVLKSALMWIIMWFWRIVNGHALLEMILFSIFIDRLWEFLLFIQYLGFIVLMVLIFLTEVHYHDVTNYIGKLAVTMKSLEGSNSFPTFATA